MDLVMLSRLQFAAAAMFHFLFVPLTLGLSVLVAIMETIYVVKGDEMYRRMARFWGKLFVINFVIGVVTGLTLEFQFGTNWSKYSAFVGDIFGSILAIEALLAFFLESTFLGVWIFGWGRVPDKLHLASIWIVTIASLLSAFWIITANAWMQHPVGYHIVNGRAELTDFFAVITQEMAWIMFMHTVFGTFILAGFFVMGISAYHLLRRQNVTFFKKSFAIAAWFALIFAILEVIQGHINGADVAHYQPEKLAAMEAHWETTDWASQTLFLIPDPKNERNLFEFGKVPGLLSLLAYHRPEAEVKGLKHWPKDERPPVLLPFFSFRIMVALGLLFPLLAGFGWLVRKQVEKWPVYLHIMLYAIPLPYIALQAGWILTEVGRQPWIVYRVLRTSDAASPIKTEQVVVSFIAFILVYGTLGLIAFVLLAWHASRGPEAAPIMPDPKAGETKEA
ncbi:MAG: cytochrome ubiquinol oxidase subunit I [Candidatus Sumerlaeia bacterium]